MKKKILIGSMLVLTLLLLMPSIPAIQQKTIEDKAYSDFVEELKDIDLKDIKEIKKFLNEFWSEHPILGFILFILEMRCLRGGLLMFCSTHFDEWPDFEIYHPLIFLRGLWLVLTSLGVAYLINIFAYLMGWIEFD